MSHLEHVSLHLIVRQDFSATRANVSQEVGRTAAVLLRLTVRLAFNAMGVNVLPEDGRMEAALLRLTVLRGINAIVVNVSRVAGLAVGAPLTQTVPLDTAVNPTRACLVTKDKKPEEVKKAFFVTFATKRKFCFNLLLFQFNSSQARSIPANI